MSKETGLGDPFDGGRLTEYLVEVRMTQQATFTVTATNRADAIDMALAEARDSEDFNSEPWQFETFEAVWSS